MQFAHLELDKYADWVPASLGRILFYKANQPYDLADTDLWSLRLSIAVAVGMRKMSTRAM